MEPNYPHHTEWLPGGVALVDARQMIAGIALGRRVVLWRVGDLGPSREIELPVSARTAPLWEGGAGLVGSSQGLIKYGDEASLDVPGPHVFAIGGSPRQPCWLGEHGGMLQGPPAVTGAPLPAALCAAAIDGSLTEGYTATVDRRLARWNLQTGEQELDWITPATVTRLAPSRDGAWLAAAGGKDLRTVLLWRRNRVAIQASVELPAPILNLVWSSRDAGLIAGTTAGVFLIRRGRGLHVRPLAPELHGAALGLPLPDANAVIVVAFAETHAAPSMPVLVRIPRVTPSALSAGSRVDRTSPDGLSSSRDLERASLTIAAPLHESKSPFVASLHADDGQSLTLSALDWDARARTLANAEVVASATTPAQLLALHFLSQSTLPRTQWAHCRMALRLALPMVSATPDVPLRGAWPALSPGDVRRLAQTSLTSLFSRCSEALPPLGAVDWLRLVLEMASSLWDPPASFAGDVLVHGHRPWPLPGAQGGIQVSAPLILRLGALASIATWLPDRPRVAGLPLALPASRRPHSWIYSLLFADPAAPRLGAADRHWLCDGVIGPPGRSQLVAEHHAGLLQAPPSLVARCQAFRHALPAIGAPGTDGRHVITLPRGMPVLGDLGVACLRLVVRSDGLWIRLIPADGGWGRLLWWRPDGLLPDHWNFVVGDAASSLHVLLAAVMAAVWQDGVCDRLPVAPTLHQLARLLARPELLEPMVVAPSVA